MNTWLYLTAEGIAEPSLNWPCCRWSASGTRQPMLLHQAAQALAGQTVDLLLPMELCSWVRSDPWPSKRRPVTQAIAYAVEDQIGESLEALHLSAGLRDAHGRYPLWVIDRERFAAVLSLLAGLGIKVRSVVVDADLMPAEKACAVRWFGRWLLGGALPLRLALTDENLPHLDGLLPDAIQRYDDRENPLALDRLLCGGFGAAIDLRHGEFAPSRSLRIWHLAGGTLLMLLLLTWGASETRLHFLDSETRRLYSENEQRFKALYPQHSRIVDLSAQWQAMQRQQGQSRETPMASLVRWVEQVIGASQVEVRRIEFREGGGWKVQLTANSFAELEQLRERGRQQGVAVKIEGASKARDRVMATLTLEAGA
ncbi:type II secretory protein pull [Pseudomonas syringae]|nr:type II secretory protein pull [Pseudomonas syringae]MCF5069872.1 type II secretory protein pull [Pseudomonas syringae]